MGEVLGMGPTHWPLLIQPDEAKSWPFLRTLRNNPDIPEEMKIPTNWPEDVRVEYGEDDGASAHKAHRDRLVRAFRVLRAELDSFKPDFVLLFGDDQYENFKENIIPPFCVLAYDDLTSYPYRRRKLGGERNVWGEPEDHAVQMKSRPDVARWLARRYLEEGVDMSYAYRPLHWEGLGHAFVNIPMFLDYDRKGFDHPIVPVQVNCYGSKVIRNHGGGPTLDSRDKAFDPPSPSPKRCFELGRVTARILKDSPYRVAMYASGGWSHGFLVDKNYCLWPDLDADRLRAAQITENREIEWRDIATSEIEETGQQEFLNWVCMAGAMHELGQPGEVVDFIETAGVFNSGKCLAVYRP